LVYERARAGGGAPDGQTRDEESGGCAASWTEAERGPDQQRKEGGRPDEEVQRGGRLQPEDEPAENDPQQDDPDPLPEAPPVPEHVPQPRRRHQERRDDDVADGIAHPPHAPGREELRPRKDAAQEERRDAHGRADGGAEQGGQHDEREDVFEPAEPGIEAGNPAQGVGAQDGLQRVPRTDTQSDPGRSARPQVHHQRAERNAGPQSLAEEDERRQRQAAWRPDWSRKPAHGGDHQPELPRDYVPRREEGDGGCLAGSGRGHDSRNLISSFYCANTSRLGRAAGW